MEPYICSECGGKRYHSVDIEIRNGKTYCKHCYLNYTTNAEGSTGLWSDKVDETKPHKATFTKFFLIAAFTIIAFSIVFVFLIPANPITTGVREGFLSWKNDIWHTKNCTAIIMHGSCFQFKPRYCDNGEITDRPDMCGCEKGFRQSQLTCVPTVNCTDGSFSPDCSSNQPYQCLNGTLIEKASLCGCLDDYEALNDTCKKIERCVDGTAYTHCSDKKPLYCQDGSLVENASMCGCPEGMYWEIKDNIFTGRCELSKNSIVQDETSTNQGSFSSITLERHIHELINIEREKNGLPALSLDAALSTIARKHSQDMASRNYFQHDTPEGQTFYNRMQQDGYNCAIEVGNTIYQGAENIFEESGYSADRVPSTTVEGWMNSPGHRTNILTPYWRNEGIGVAKSSNGEVYVTQDFC